MKYIKQFIAWLKKQLGKKDETTTAPTADPQPAPEPAPAPTVCTCDLSNLLCEPDKGEECPVPWGMDVRFLAWSPSTDDWVFIGFNKGSATLNGKQITGNCFEKNGKQYHFLGHKQKSSAADMLEERTVECKPCHRVYYEARAL